MDKRISYKIVLDTETCPLKTDLDIVLPTNMLVYDIGWIVSDKKGNVYETRSFVVRDIFIEQKKLMQSAYYADKIPSYWKDIQNGTRKIRRLFEVRKILVADMLLYNISELYAHNARFDDGSLNNTVKFITKGKIREFLPKQLVVCDTLKMARDVILKMPTYKNFCIENNLVCKNGTLKATAEALYRFIKYDLSFEESHTGLEDVLIEKEIMAYCYKQKKKMRKRLYE